MIVPSTVTYYFKNIDKMVKSYWDFAKRLTWKKICWKTYKKKERTWSPMGKNSRPSTPLPLCGCFSKGSQLFSNWVDGSIEVSCVAVKMIHIHTHNHNYLRFFVDHADRLSHSYFCYALMSMVYKNVLIVKLAWVYRLMLNKIVIIIKQRVPFPLFSSWLLLLLA